MSEISELDSKFLNINREYLIGWHVFYYIDGEVVEFNSEEHNWIDLPDIGVMYLYRIYTNHKEQISGCDYYCPYQLMEVDDIRPWIKFGLYLDDQTFNNEVWPYVLNHDINK